MTWRVQSWRNDSPHPVSHYHRGDQAEDEARKRADERGARSGIRKVEVDQIERQRSEGGPVFPGEIEP